MRANLFVKLLLIAAGCAAGCAVSDESAETSSATSELAGGVPTGVQCSDKTWTVNFYQEPALIHVVGTMQCICYQPELLAGVTSNYTKLIREFTCSLQ
jgi:hypothetical protein